MNIYYDRQEKKHTKPQDTPVNWRISSYALVVNSNDKLLSVMPTWNTKWELPGGGVEIRETLEEAAVREFYEETGYKITISNHRPIYVGESKAFLEDVGAYIHSIIIIFEAKLSNQKQNISAINTTEKNEIFKIEWIHANEFNKTNCNHLFWPLIQKLSRNDVQKIYNRHPRS